MENYLIAVQSPHGFHALGQLSSQCESIHAIGGISSDGVQHDVWLVTSASMTLDKLYEKDNLSPRIRVNIVKFSIPMQRDELAQARALLLSHGFDTLGVGNSTLKHFIEDRLNGNYSRYLHLESTQVGEPVKASLRLTKDFAIPTNKRRSASKQHK